MILSPVAFDANTDRYVDATDAYAWLAATGGAQAELADDAIDAMRVLRAADVLRQRGTVLRTSGGFEVCMDAETAHAVCTLRPATGDAAYVITYDDPRGAGEANIREAVVTDRGHLRIAFHRGGFATPGAVERAASSTAGVVVDIQADVVPSFSGHSVGGGLDAAGAAARPRSGSSSSGPTTGRRSPTRSRRTSRPLHPELAPRLVTVADTQTADRAERARFLAAEPLDGDGADGGRPPAAAQPSAARTSMAWTGRSRSRRSAGPPCGQARYWSTRGSAPSFVYVPMADGLVVRPIGGYASSPLPAWVPVGTTGVIRRAERNSDIVAVADVDVVVIPGELYARAWLRPLTAGELVGAAAADGQRMTLSTIERVVALHRVGLFADVPGRTLAALAQRAREVEVDAGVRRHRAGGGRGPPVRDRGRLAAGPPRRRDARDARARRDGRASWRRWCRSRAPRR